MSKTQTAQVLRGAALCVGAFSLGWLVRASGDGSESQPSMQSVQRSRADPALRADERLSDVGLEPGERAPVGAAATTAPVAILPAVTEPTMQEALAALDRAMKLRPIFEDDDKAFAAKYEGASVPAMKEALTLLRTRVDAEQDRIIEDRMAAGLFEQSFVSDGDRAPALQGKGKGLSTFGFRSSPAPGGGTILKTTEITPEEYPGFNASRMEMWWLIRALRGK